MTDNIEAALSALETPISPEVQQGEPDWSDTDNIPQGILDLAGGMVSELRPELKADAIEEEVPEDSVEEQEQESTEDIAEDIEADDEEAVEEEELSDDLPDSVVEYDELKNHTLRFKVGGEWVEKNIDQIASEMGQVKAASRAQSEVKAQQEETARMREALEAERELFQQQQQTVVESQKLAQLRNRMEEGQRVLDVARQNNDVNQMVRVRDQLDLLAQEYQKTEAHVQQVQRQTNAQLVAEQKNKLNDLGYGSLLSDTQRLNALSEYLNQNLSTSAVQAVDYDATLLVALEKARQWDASQKKTGKLKTSSKKTLKAGSGKSSAPKKELTPDEAIYQHALKLMGG